METSGVPQPAARAGRPPPQRTGPEGKATLLDLFKGRHQLIVYHLMWLHDRDLACPSCSWFDDRISHLAHLHASDTTFAAVSRAPIAKIEPFKARMGWTFPGTHQTGRI